MKRLWSLFKKSFFESEKASQAGSLMAKGEGNAPAKLSLTGAITVLFNGHQTRLVIP
jgi:hypothetical protein